MAHPGSHPLLRLDGVTKVFLTEDVETHALSGVHADRTIQLFDGRVVADEMAIASGAFAPAMSTVRLKADTTGA